MSILEEANWGKTEVVTGRLKYSPFFEEADKESRNGYWQNRPIIGRDSPINGGVYLGGGAREAIVVDDGKYELLRRKYNDLIKILEPHRQEDSLKGNVLNAVFDFVKKTLPYNQETVDILARRYKLAPDQKISLTDYIKEGGGVCRHQALFGAYLLEKLKSDGYIRGNVSIDRNYVLAKGGHAWIRYTNSRGKVFIVDPAQDYIGAMEDIEKDRWFYERPEDKT